MNHNENEEDKGGITDPRRILVRPICKFIVEDYEKLLTKKWKTEGVKNEN